MLRRVIKRNQAIKRTKSSGISTLTANRFATHTYEPGIGFKNRGNLNLVLSAEPLAYMCIDSIPDLDTRTEPINIADFGTGDGGSTVLLFARCVELIRSRNATVPIQVFYNDVITNDFKTLFYLVLGQLESPSFYQPNSNIFVHATPTNFYDQCYPESINLGVSFSAMHLLSKSPGSINGYFHPNLVPENERETNEEFMKYKEQAAEDWKNLLIARSKDLTKGGKMLMGNLSVDDYGHFLGNTSFTDNSVFHILNGIWDEMKKEGKISEEEYKRFTVNQYYRTKQEFMAPFDDKESELVKNGLSYVSNELHLTRCPIFEMYDGLDGSKKKPYAKDFVPAVRSMLFPSVLESLSCDRTVQERREITNMLFHTYEAIVERAPLTHSLDYVSSHMVVTKE
eukprot:TRINITY_DN8868_c0_g1_i1.p1 TRINITY_DN8868_c0_g1~~TRINITY_DN8868_c0_g1_i1.p1  ORF type:complete len:397 (-),score=83.09 TRINITY_DN8868_c0_g1_i1:16-1206(-)